MGDAASGIFNSLLAIYGNNNSAVIFELQSFFGELMDIGKLKQDTISYKLLKFLDKQAVETASGLVVLEENGKMLLEKQYPGWNSDEYRQAMP